MIDVQELKMPNNVYLEKYDIKVRPYLTLDEISEIGDTLILADDLATQEAILITSVLDLCTDMPKEYIQVENEDGEENESFLDYNIIIQSGLWAEIVKVMSTSIDRVWAYVENKEDSSKAMARFINSDLTNLINQAMELLTKWEKKMPRGKQWTQMLEGFPQRLVEAVASINADGNAEIIKNALEMNTVNKNAKDK